MQGLCANRVHNLAWEEEARAGSFVARAARFVLHAQVEAGTLCPVTMTFAATPLLLQMLPATFHDWLAPLLAIATIRICCRAGKNGACSSAWE